MRSSAVLCCTAQRPRQHRHTGYEKHCNTGNNLNHFSSRPSDNKRCRTVYNLTVCWAACPVQHRRNQWHEQEHSRTPHGALLLSHSIFYGSDLNYNTMTLLDPTHNLDRSLSNRNPRPNHLPGLHPDRTQEQPIVDSGSQSSLGYPSSVS